MKNNHSEQWEILRFQGKMYQREKIVLYAIIVLLIIALVLSNIIWASRHNSATASAVNPEIEIKEVVEVTEALPPQQKNSKKKEYYDSGG